MNNEENNNQVVNTKPTSGEVEVLGELRKEKIGKPMVVVEIAVLILIVVFALPVVFSAMNDESSTFYQILHGRVDTPDEPETPVDEVKDGLSLQQLNNNTTMKANNLIMKNFSFKGNEITVTMYSYTGILDLDEEPYYLEIYSDQDNKLGQVKLIGLYDSSEKQAVLSAKGLNFNASVSYYGKVVIMKDADYPTITISSDESGIGSFKCTKGTRTIEYVFQNTYLSEIRDNETITRQGLSDQEYLDILDEYNNKVATIKEMNTSNEAYVEEASTGLSFVSRIILKDKDDIYDHIDDKDYYNYNTEAKVIHYAEEGKGFDCE